MIPGLGRSSGEGIGYLLMGFPGGSEGKESACNAGDLGLIRGLGRSSGGRHGNPLQYLSGESPWTEEPGGLQSTGSQTVQQTEPEVRESRKKVKRK